MTGRISRLIDGQQTGTITGDDGLDYPFKAHSLVGVAFGSLHPGLGVVFTPAVSSGERQALTVRVPTK